MRCPLNSSGDDPDDDYMQFLAEEESGFLSDTPPTIISMSEALHRIAKEAGGTCRELSSTTPKKRKKR